MITINYCPEHGDLLARPGDGADARSYRCREAHHIDEIHAGFRRSEVPEPSAEGYAKFEDWEQEMFRHQPVLSMADGSVAGCQCLDRVFVKGREDWGSHLAAVITARLPEPQGEPSDARVRAIRMAFADELTGLGVYSLDIHEIRKRAAQEAR